MFNLLLNLCDKSAFLRILYLFKVITKLICIVVPIILIVTLMIDLTKAIINSDDSKIAALKKNGITKIIAAVVVFLVPTFVSMFLGVFNFSEYENCMRDYTLEEINDIKAREDEQRKREQEDKEAQARTNQESYNNGTYTGNSNGTRTEKRYTSTKNGIVYNLYNQSDSRWGNYEYPGEGKTISDKGCMITSTAIISSASNPSITPLNVFNDVTNGRKSYPYTAVPYFTGSDFTCKYDTNDVVQELKNGNVVVIQVKGGTKGDSKFTFDEHYMALLDYDSSTNKIFVGNSYSSGTGYTASGWFSKNEVLTSVHVRNVCTPSASLINKYKSGSSNSNGGNTTMTAENNVTFTASNKTTVNYYVMVPNNATANMPMIVYLHGGGSNCSNVSSSEFAKVTKDLYGNNFPYILLMPCTSSYFMTHDYSFTLYKELVNSVADKYKVNKSKISLAGTSNGCEAAWQFTSKIQGLFSATEMVSCGYDQYQYLDNYKNIPVRLYLSSESYDMNFKTHNENYCNKINETGGNCKFEIINGLTHMNGATIIYGSNVNGKWVDGAYSKEKINWLINQTK